VRQTVFYWHLPDRLRTGKGIPLQIIQTGITMNDKLIQLLVAMALTVLTSGCTKGKLISEEGNLVPPTVEHNTALPFVALNGTLLHAEAFGNPDSTIIIVLHGGPGADYLSLLNCKAFAEKGYRVVFYDQRGSGLSKRHSKASYSLQLMYDDLTAVINHYRKSPSQKIFLLGHSWGAILATGYINKYPATINAAILAEPGGLVYDDITGYLKRAKKINYASELANDVSYPDQFITGGKDQHEILDYKYALLAVADGAKENPTGNEARPPFWRFGSVVDMALTDIGEREKPDFTGGLHRFTTKILFVFSANNKAYGPDYALHVSSAFFNVELLKVNDAGHDLLAFQRGWNNFFPPALAYFNSLK
jgi:proline iminopeptidase